MPCERSLDRHLRGLQVPDFTHHYDVGVLAQNGAQRMCKGEPNSRLHLNLVYACELILDRVLHREQLALRSIEQIERRIEGRRLAAAGGTCNQNDAIRLV